MKLYFLALLATGCCVPRSVIAGTVPRYAWTHTWGTNQGGLVIQAASSDGSGNVIVGGCWGGVLDFDPGPALDLQDGPGNAFVTKLYSDGSYGWTFTAGGTGIDDGNGLAVGPGGEIFLAGSFQGSVDFQPGEGVDLHVAGTAPHQPYNAFVTKLNPDGSYGWTKSFQVDADAHVYANDVAVDPLGDVVLVGGVAYGVDFDPGPGTDYQFRASLDIFVTKLAPDGSYLWTRTFGGAGNEHGTGVACDPAGNTLVTGNFRGIADFDPGPGVDWHQQVGEIEDIFVSKYGPDGSYLWTRTMAADAGDRGQVAVDAHGAAYLTGLFHYPVDFDPTSGVDLRTPMPGPVPRASDIWITKIHSDGSYGWTYTAGGEDYDAGAGVAAGPDGVQVTGRFRSTVDFDPGPALDIRVSVGTTSTSDAFMLHLGQDGSYRWTRTWGGAGNDLAGPVAIGPDGHLLVAGSFDADPSRADRADADPTCGVDERIFDNNGLRPAFITKLLCADPGDFDLDGDVDLLDLARFQTCFTGPDAPRCSPGCDAFDIASADPASSGVDNAIDLADFAALAPLLTGP